MVVVIAILYGNSLHYITKCIVPSRQTNRTSERHDHMSAGDVKHLLKNH